jgi:hypothetical protein
MAASPDHRPRRGRRALRVRAAEALEADLAAGADRLPRDTDLTGLRDTVGLSDDTAVRNSMKGRLILSYAVWSTQEAPWHLLNVAIVRT